MKKNRTLRYSLIAVFLLIIISFIGKKAGLFGKPDLLEVSVEKPKLRTITENINANGKIQPEIEIKISSEVSGEIIELSVREGDLVKKGQLLCRIKPDTYISMKERAIASVNSSKARLVQVQAQLAQNELAFNRSSKLFEQKAISESDFETAKTSYQMAKADVQAATYNVESAEASLRESIENLNKTTIYAPVGGTISKLSVELGERVVGTAQMAGTEIMRIADLSRMETRVSVNENDIVRVKLNDTALVEVDAYPTEKFKGLVTQIANSASTTGVATDQVTTFEVRIFILDNSYKHLLNEGISTPFRPGMSTAVDIQTQTKVNILSIPIQAVTTRSDSIKRRDNLAMVAEEDTEQDNTKKVGTTLQEVVFVVVDDVAKMLVVKTGIQDNQHIEVTEGLTTDDQVVIAPFGAISRKLSNGKSVKVVPYGQLNKNAN